MRRFNWAILVAGFGVHVGFGATTAKAVALWTLVVAPFWVPRHTGRH